MMQYIVFPRFLSTFLPIMVFSFVVMAHPTSAQSGAPRWTQKFDELESTNWHWAVEGQWLDSNAVKTIEQSFSGLFLPILLRYGVDNHHEVFRIEGMRGDGKGPADWVSFTLYSDNNQPKLIVEEYTNNSRMGSCGDIGIEIRGYWKGGEIAYCETREEPFECYSNPVDTNYLERVSNTLLESGGKWAFNAYLQGVEQYAATLLEESSELDSNGNPLYFKEYEKAITPDIIYHPENYELVWIYKVLEGPVCKLGEEFPSFQVQVPMNGKYIGDKYFIYKVNGGEPTGIIKYTEYYYRRKKNY